jgi:RNA processing factor Prp31
VALLCTKILGQFEFRANIQEYLKNKMVAVAPNLTTIVGENVAKIIIK